MHSDRSKNRIALPACIAALAFAALAVRAVLRLRAAWDEGVPSLDLSAALWITLAAAAVLAAVWGVLRGRILRSETSERRFRAALAVLFALVPAAALTEAGLMNTGSWFFSAVASAGIAGCLLWPLLRRQKILYAAARILALVILAGGFICLDLGLNMIFGTMGPDAPDGTPAVVLGSQVVGDQPNEDLRARIDAAAVWLQAHPSSVAVACGGQGEGERITEAACIRRELISRGIGGNRIILDDRSMNTEENIGNAAGILRNAGFAADSGLAVITDDYHCCRARLLVRSAGIAAAYPVPAVTPASCAAVSVMREFLALAVRLVKIAAA